MDQHRLPLGPDILADELAAIWPQQGLQAQPKGHRQLRGRQEEWHVHLHAHRLRKKSFIPAASHNRKGGERGHHAPVGAHPRLGLPAQTAGHSGCGPHWREEAGRNFADPVVHCASRQPAATALIDARKIAGKRRSEKHAPEALKSK